MNEINLEYRAQELLRHNEYSEALVLFNQLLSLSNPNLVSKERIISYLLARSECCLVLGKHEDVVFDCRKIIKLLAGTENEASLGAKARRRLVHALFTLNRFGEAEQAAQEWIASCPNGGSVNAEALKMLERVQMVVRMVNGNSSPMGVPPQQQQQQQQQHLVQKSNLMKSMAQNNSSSYFDGLDSTWAQDVLPHISAKPLDNLLDMNNSATSAGFGVSNYLNQQPGSIPPSIANGLGFNNGFSTPNESVNPLANMVSPSSTNSQSSSEDSSCVSRKSSMNNGSLEASIQPEKTISLAAVNSPSNLSGSYNCVYCSLTFSDKTALRSHCTSEAHQMVIMSDEGRDWKWRPPPRGFTADNYSLCEWFEEGGETACRYGAQCVEAHGTEELAEWRQRFEYRQMKLARAKQHDMYGSYTEELLERWIQSSCPDKILKEDLEDVDVACDNPLVTAVSSKQSEKHWTFTVTCTRPLKAVALLQDAHRSHFKLESLSSTDVTHGSTTTHDLSESDQEWVAPSHPSEDAPTSYRHVIKLMCKTEIYGTFRQSVVVDLGREPVLVRHVCVDVIPITHVEKIREIKKELVLSNAERWEPESVVITKFTSTAVNVDSESDSALCALYPPPRAHTFALTQSSIEEKRLTRYNYKPRMHELLCVEEMARYEQVARYNVRAKLKLVDCYLLSPSGVAGSTAKYAQSGELFAVLNLGKDISEDTSAGRLILNNCAYVFFSDIDESTNKNAEGKRIVHEVYIEDKGKNVIYLRVSSNTTSGLKLKKNTDVTMDVQFQLNRVPYCEWHQAIDSVADFRIIFPDTYVEPHIPPVSSTVCSTLASKLNSKQTEAVAAITAPKEITLPPVLIIGPFGTGKTYTLANAIKEVLKQDDTRILVCTHSNSAADLYIKDYLHPYVQEGHDEAKPLRIYYHKRWVATVNSVVQQYCVIQMNNGIREFKMPSLEEIEQHRVVVVTLSISLHLATVGLKKGHFTHILLDEAAQAMECEAIMPLALANDNTRIVLAGDHMQLSPEIFSQFAKERNLHVSLLERLYDHYPSSFPCKILLRENYRAHDAIIEFTSALFYEQQLIASGNQPRHDKLYPLTFFTTRGEDVQDHNSTAFYNNSEVYEVVERVSELKKKWPAAWGKLDEHAIGIMTPYSDQVVRIRSELRKRRMGGISVERVLNVQGKQFRAIFLSTVRTRRTCTSSTAGNEDLDYGFLSNSKLLNTAITRAQSLVAVVGDPLALCSIGRCRKVWERFIEICHTNDSLFGITWKSLRAQLDGVELKKTYVLNPLAPEFVPRSFQAESYIRLPPAAPSYQPPLYNYPNVSLPSPPTSSFLHMRPPPPLQNQWLPGWSKVKSSSSKESSIASPLSSTDDFPRHLGLTNQRTVQRSLSPSIDFTNPATFLRPPPNMMNNVHLIEPQRRVEKEMQFLQNVHFPLPETKLEHLLPHNVSLNELVNSPNKQYEWFIHLVDTAGIETANKFFEFITSNSVSSNITPLSPVQQQLNNLDLMHKQRLVPTSSPQNSFVLNSQLMDLESLLSAQQPLQQRPHTWYAQSPTTQNAARLLGNTSLNNLATTRLDDLKNYSIRDIEAVLLLDQQATSRNDNWDAPSPFMYKRVEENPIVLNKIEQQQMLNSDLLRPQDNILAQHQQMQLLQQKYKQSLDLQQQSEEQKHTQHQQYLLNSEIQRLQQQQHNLQQLHQQQLAQQQLQQQQQQQQQQREEYLRQVNASSSGFSLQHSLSSPNMMSNSQPHTLNFSNTPVFVNSNGGPAVSPLQHSTSVSTFPPQQHLMQGPPVNKLMNGHHMDHHPLSPQQQQKQMMPPQTQKPLTYASVLRQTQVEPPRKQEMQPAALGKLKPGGGDPFAVFRDLGNKQTGLYQYFS